MCLAVGSVANALLPRTKGEGMGLLPIALAVGAGIGLPIGIFFRTVSARRLRCIAAQSPAGLQCMRSCRSAAYAGAMRAAPCAATLPMCRIMLCRAAFLIRASSWRPPCAAACRLTSSLRCWRHRSRDSLQVHLPAGCWFAAWRRAGMSACMRRPTQRPPPTPHHHTTTTIPCRRGCSVGLLPAAPERRRAAACRG